MSNYIVLGLLFITALLTGCGQGLSTFIHKPTILQGNIISQKEVQKLKPGMTADEVITILGSPLLVDTFNPNRWDYMYREYSPYAPLKEDRLTLFFEDGRLKRMVTSVEPGQ